MDLIEKTKSHHRHPWEESRTFNVMELLVKNDAFTYADIGAGDRYFTNKLRERTKGKIYAIDKGYSADRQEVNGVFCLSGIEQLDDNSCDYLIMMDVLEHVENEDEFLKIVISKLKEGGKILLTVPAMQFLFSSHDVFLMHYRRYSRKKITDTLQRNNIIVDRCFYFYFSLFIARYASLVAGLLTRNQKQKNVGIGSWRFGQYSVITRFFVFLLNKDFLLSKIFNKNYFQFPGLSVLAICRKG